MKGIELCADCAFYNLKSHKCTCGCEIEPDSEKGEDVHFFVDCVLPDVQPVKCGEWIASTGYGGWGEQYYNCSCCNNQVEEKKNFCDECGADMRGTEI